MNNKTILYALCLFLNVAVSGVAAAQSLSDTAIKTNVKAIESPLQKILQLEPWQFQYRTENYKYLKLSGGNQYGFMTDNVQAVFPDLVKEKKVSYSFGKNAYRNAAVKTIDETGLIPVLVASVKQQQEMIEALKAEIAALKSAIAEK